MTNGYFKLQRRFFAHWLWTEKRCLSKAEAWLDLLQIAAFMPTKRIVRDKLLKIEEGELVASLRYLADRWEWNKDKVAAFLKLLESEEMIRRESRQGESVIILCNYKDYTRTPDMGSDTGGDRGQTPERQRPDKYEEREEGQKGKGEDTGKIITITRPMSSPETEPPRPPTFADVQAFAGGVPMGISPECIAAFFDEMETLQWTYKGQPCVVKSAWHARFRKWATYWANNEAGARRTAK